MSGSAIENKYDISYRWFISEEYRLDIAVILLIIIIIIND